MTHPVSANAEFAAYAARGVTMLLAGVLTALAFGIVAGLVTGLVAYGLVIVIEVWIGRRHYRRLVDDLETRGVRAVATVGFVGHPNDDPEATQAHYRFEAAGVAYYGIQSFGVSRGGDPAMPLVGDHIPILYDPDRPEINGWEIGGPVA